MTREEVIKDLRALKRGGVTENMNLSLDTAIAALPVPDPETGLVPCGCGGKPCPHFQLGWYREDSDSQAFEVCIGCDECGLSTKPRRGLYINGKDTDETEMKSRGDWNTARGYTEDEA